MKLGMVAAGALAEIAMGRLDPCSPDGENRPGCRKLKSTTGRCGVIRLLLALCVWVGSCGVLCLADQPASTQPAATADLIAQLGDPDPQIRERATRQLWARGQAVSPDLREAAAGGDPEIARRARSILRDFDYGLY